MPNGKKMVGSYRYELTDSLLEYIGKNDTNVIGFYILKESENGTWKDIVMVITC